VFKAYEVGEYKDVISMLSGMTVPQFQSLKQDDMTLLHHVAFDGKVEVAQMMATLPYFSEIINDDNNEVRDKS